jgi:hypothetical protein
MHIETANANAQHGTVMLSSIKLFSRRPPLNLSARKSLAQKLTRERRNELR